MTKRPGPTRLSAGEMEMLEMLWRLGPVALSEAHAGLGRSIGYTTVQTRLNRLVEKRLVMRARPIDRRSTRPPSCRRRSVPAISICCWSG